MMDWISDYYQRRAAAEAKAVEDERERQRIVQRARPTEAVQIAGEPYAMYLSEAEMSAWRLRQAAAECDERAARVNEPGKKADAGKPRIDLIAPELLFGVAEILDFGARKYGERNWEKGMSWSRPFAALMRHMWAWWSGDRYDDETGRSHLWHAACCIMFLIAFEERAVGKDDRAKNMVDGSGV